MNILLWILQVVIAFFCISGATWRLLNFEEAAKAIGSIAALPYSAWMAIAFFEIVCALCLIIPGLLKMKMKLTAMAAGALTIEMLLITALHVNYFGLAVTPTNPAMWTMMLSGMSAFVAYGRFVLKPL